MDVKVPDIGDFKDVPVVTVLVSVGDTVSAEDPLIELESDKATMEVPSPAAGKITEIKVAEGDRVSEGTVIMVLESADAKAEDAPKAADAAPVAPQSVAATGTASGKGDVHAEVVVLGSGPGGYTAAFRAADLGKKVVLIEKYPSLGGVCLNVGCIPSKALLHVAKVITEAEEMSSHGISFGKPKIDLDELRDFKNSVVGQLTGGLSGLAKGRKVQVVQGYGTFTGPNMIEVIGDSGKTNVSFNQCIIAAGSEPVNLPFIPHDDERVIDSTGALELKDIPKRMLILGGGIIGLEMACVYDALGSKISVVEFMDQLMPGADKDIVKPLHKRIEGRYENIWLKTKVTNVEAQKKGLKVTFENDKGETFDDTFDKVLVAVGRKPNGKVIDAEKAGVAVDDRGFIAVDNQQRTGVPHIFAIGDVVGQPMLAHKAVHEGKVAAEVCAGHKRFFDASLIPSVAYTDPEVAWCGVTETQAKAQGIKYEKGVFPWAASGRSLANGRNEGITKLLFDPEDDRVIGACIVGTNAGDLISEVALAIEMGADAVDLGHTIHPHPTLSETVNFAAEMFEGTITDLMPPKKKKA
ncbi:MULTISPECIES: dihydrolipoyl dehydrogenase [Marivita]|uniref:Dihydrolipoyl dehydrogenase n=1 Tax=Marivita cryptomonadis TaxID=505252 RepID=A0A9Q2NXB5_9RHOB|nr:MULTISPECIES: dihydrolipoyl dehydrogenase [Marivita]MCR9166864.1 dihydrolipoyl dehydrogenase [Paracoccaceae bacterium]MBM2322996.1 dihydrolipoyl dehydrogenase [Marivita cryptomonadis]MBM2332452.1 dihydrolipoyl dehydrogenase [Marivita cryptomonadis]MBM2342035.1 dihydrolipoyl dehydrogenase [Marivita cryptomonadis]MBM2346826.1 dihydrolipoyl dehydrogenase [Marivita cryptomonadis]